MNRIVFDRVTFAWPDDQAGGGQPLFSSLNLRLDEGLTFLVGPNGIGKSSLMLLGGARVFPQQGRITILDVDSDRFIDAGIDPTVEEARNRLVSFIYQNMELETEESVGALLDIVAESSGEPERAAALREELVAAAELGDALDSRMQELSKGEMQRAIVAMSVLYGSPIVMMDEPLFAVEPARSERLFEYLRHMCAATGTSMYASVHDVKLARTYADSVVLFDAAGEIHLGDPETLLARERVEAAFRAPFDTLYERQNLYRDLLKKSFGTR